MNRLQRIALVGLMLLTALIACGGGEIPTPIVIVVTAPPPQADATPEVVQPASPQAAIEILEATFAHGLTEEMQPVDPGADFAPGETIYLSLRIKGRAEEGVVTARFYWGDTFIAEADVDLADANSGLIFSIGEDTYAGYTLTSDAAFPVGEGYRADVSYDGDLLGGYPFRVVPPSGAIPSKVEEVVLAMGVDEDYNPLETTTVFAFDDTVYLAGRGDLGQATWLQADWYVDGRLDQAGTRSFTMEENAPDTGFAFSYVPEGGWPPGEHFVVLTMNGMEVGDYSFTVISSGGAAPLEEAAFWEAFPVPEDAEAVPVVEGVDMGFATTMQEPDLFDAYAAWLRDQGWQQQAPTDAMETLPHQTWRKDGAELVIEIEGLDEEGRTIVWVQLTALDQ
jgi:hypothetical protein